MELWQIVLTTYIGMFVAVICHEIKRHIKYENHIKDLNEATRVKVSILYADYLHKRDIAARVRERHKEELTELYKVKKNEQI